jgi:hypothetical protein
VIDNVLLGNVLAHHGPDFLRGCAAAQSSRGRRAQIMKRFQKKISSSAWVQVKSPNELAGNLSAWRSTYSLKSPALLPPIRFSRA